jgi:hypothetical protein
MYSQIHTYPITHAMTTTMMSVTRDAADGLTFGKSEATSAPKNWALKRNENALGNEAR